MGVCIVVRARETEKEIKGPRGMCEKDVNMLSANVDGKRNSVGRKSQSTWKGKIVIKEDRLARDDLVVNVARGYAHCRA